MLSRDISAIKFICDTFDHYINKQKTDPPVFDPKALCDEFAGNFIDRREFNPEESPIYSYVAEAYVYTIKDQSNEEMIRSMELFRDTCKLLIKWGDEVALD